MLWFVCPLYITYLYNFKTSHLSQALSTWSCHDISFNIQLGYCVKLPCPPNFTWTDLRPAVRPIEGPNSFHWKYVKLKVLPCCTKFHEPHVVLEYAHFLNNINAMKAPSTHRSSIFSAIQRNNQRSTRNTSYVCHHAVHSCGTWRTGAAQSPRNDLSISDFGLDVIETSTGVCDPD